VVVYSDLGGFVTTGVASEVEHALSKGKPVYRLDWRTGEITKINELGKAISITESRALIDALNYLLLDEVELAHMINSRWKGNFLNTLLDLMNDPSLRRLDRLSELNLINLLNRFYHWWQEPAKVTVKADMEKLQEIIIERLKLLEEPNLKNYIVRTLGLPKTRYDYYIYILKKGGLRSIETQNLRRLCNDLKIPYIELERRKIIANPNYPIDLNTPALLKAAVHIINKGHMRTKTKEIEYYNKDPVLHYYFKRAVEDLGGKYTGPFRASRVLVSYADSLTGRLINAIGVPYGSKSTKQPFMNLRPLSDDLWRYYFQTTLTEEGSFTLVLTKQNILAAKFSLTRTIDVTAFLPRSFVETLDEGSYSIKTIKERAIQKLIARKPPSILIAEFMELNRRHGFVAQMLPLPHPHPERIIKTKDDKVTVRWVMEIKKQGWVDLIHDYYGMLPSTWKSTVLEKVYSFYKNHRGGKLTEEETEEFHKNKEKNPWEVPQWWIQQKIRELFKRKT